MDIWGWYRRLSGWRLVGVEVVDSPEDDFVTFDAVVLIFTCSRENKVAVELKTVYVVVVDFGRVEVWVVDDLRLMVVF